MYVMYVMQVVVVHLVTPEVMSLSVGCCYTVTPPSDSFLLDTCSYYCLKTAVNDRSHHPSLLNAVRCFSNYEQWLMLIPLIIRSY